MGEQWIGMSEAVTVVAVTITVLHYPDGTTGNHGNRPVGVIIEDVYPTQRQLCTPETAL